VTPALGRRLLWSVALAGTVVAVAWVSGGDDEVVVGAAGRQRPRPGGGEPAGPPPVLALDRLAARAFDDMKVDLLAAKSWYVPPPAVAEKPKPPPLPFTYAGRLVEDGKTAVFLSRPDRNQVVRSGDVIDGTWRVDRIDATVMTLTYLPLNESQILALGATP